MPERQSTTVRAFASCDESELKITMARCKHSDAPAGYHYCDSTPYVVSNRGLRGRMVPRHPQDCWDCLVAVEHLRII